MCVIGRTTAFSYFSTPPLIHVCPVSNYFVHHSELSSYSIMFYMLTGCKLCKLHTTQ